MADFSRQCTLVRGKVKKVSWIPEKFAILGSFVKLKENNEWTNGWEVTLVGNRLEDSIVNTRSQEYKKHRNTTDI